MKVFSIFRLKERNNSKSFLKSKTELSDFFLSHYHKEEQKRWNICARKNVRTMEEIQFSDNLTLGRVKIYIRGFRGTYGSRIRLNMFTGSGSSLRPAG